jgi:hypothetical protein
MKLFENISDFNKVEDYLPIVNGAMNADIIIIFLVFHGVFKSLYIKQWYKTFNLSACIMDISILILIIIFTRFLYSYFFTEYSLLKFTGLAVTIQILHDLLFYYFFKNLPSGYNYVFDFFKKYANEVGGKAIVGDTITIILTCLLSSHFATYSLNLNVILLISSIYFIPFHIYYEK